MADVVSAQLADAGAVAHLKQIMSASDAVPELLHNALMLVNSMSTVGQHFFATSHVICYCISRLVHKLCTVLL